MTTNRTKLAVHLTLAITAAVIALKAQPGTKTHTAATELATTLFANIITRALKARWGK